MKKFLLNNSKWIYFILGIIAVIVVISAIFFMTQYKYIRINYDIQDGVIVFSKSSLLNGGDQKEIFNVIDQIANGNYKDYAQTQATIDGNSVFQTLLSTNGTDYTYLVKSIDTSNPYLPKTVYSFTNEIFTNLYNFRKSLDSYNDLILAYGLVIALVFAGLLIISNHNRRIYYKVNLIGGVVLPLINVIFAIILIVQAFSLMANINDPFNNALYNYISVYGNKSNTTLAQLVSEDSVGVANFEKAISQFNINSMTLIIYVVLFALVAAYNVFLIIYAVLKYNATAQERKEVLQRAEMAGEKAWWITLKIRMILIRCLILNLVKTKSRWWDIEIILYHIN